MKSVEKSQQEPAIYAKWRREGGWDANSPKAEKLKLEIKELLLNEQGFICCYCEDQITADKDSCHIEHLQPKGKYPHLKSEYRNLFCSCNHPKTCGYAKQDDEIRVTPLMNCCEDLFEYHDDGKIKGKDQDAVDTIEILKLNSERLIAARNKIIEILLKDDSSFSCINTLSEYDDLVQKYLQPDTNGCFRPYWSVVSYYAKEYRCVFE